METLKYAVLQGNLKKIIR